MESDKEMMSIDDDDADVGDDDDGDGGEDKDVSKSIDNSDASYISENVTQHVAVYVRLLHYCYSPVFTPLVRSYAVVPVCLFVCRSVSSKSHKRVNGCRPNMVGVGKG